MAQPGPFVPPPVRYQVAPPVAEEYPGATKNDATMVLLLGVLAFVVCQLLAPYAWIKGNTYMQVCTIHGVPPDSMAVIGRILGIVGTVMLVLSLLGGGLAVLLALVG